ncbi:hypothetical protein VNI00_006908 [Paramarasmius palmivorus]|uniref:MYND-type domain-containing protein n=1 Tax=Paramarasmius palmivorus TaxID=297713 RepID=A0AAW0DAP3_9AGAR
MATSFRTFKTHFVLAQPHEPKHENKNSNELETSPIITILTGTSHGNPFVSPFVPSNRLGVLKQVQVKEYLNVNGPGPVVEVVLDEDEVSHGCLKCARDGVAQAKFELKDALRFLKCTGCSAEYYCTKKCQNQDWKAHKTECKKKLWRYGQRDKAARLMEEARMTYAIGHIGWYGFIV